MLSASSFVGYRDSCNVLFIELWPRSVPFAKVVLVCLLVFILSFVNDIMHSNDIIVTTFLIPFCRSVHVGERAVIAKKFSNAMDERDAKSQELLSTYQQLDDELLRRETLEAANQQLERDNEIAAQQLIQADKLATMGTMVAGVAHDIANPTGLIKGAQVLAEESRVRLKEHRPCAF